MGNCLRLGISRVGLAWSKWRMSAKFKRKNISIIILGMQAVGKSTIALRLFKFKRTLPDTNYVQTKGFNTYTVKHKKTTVNIYDIGGHQSIQELWDHYYADAHGIIFVVDTSERDTVPEAGRLLSKVLSDHRIRGKPVLLLANKIDLDGVTENELDSMLNLQQLVNSVRCLTRLDVSCATDLKNDKGIFEGFKWLVTFIESNFVDINNRVLSDTMEEKNREKARREAIKAARLAEQASAENDQLNELPVEPVSPFTKTPPKLVTPPKSAKSIKSVEKVEIPNLVQETDEPQPRSKPYPPPEQINDLPTHHSPKSFNPKLSDEHRMEPPPPSTPKIPLPLLPPINTTSTNFSPQVVKLPRLKSPKSRPEVISRIEVQDDIKRKIAKPFPTGESSTNNDQYYRKISAARRLSPEGADSDDGIVNLAYEPTEDLSSDSTPIGIRKHTFSNEDENPNKELFMITTMAEVHKEYFKDRKGSTSTHDSVSMSMASEATDSINEEGYMENTFTPKPESDVTKQDEHISMEKFSKSSKGKTKKRLNIKHRGNKTAPLELPLSVTLPPGGGRGGEILRNYPINRIPLDALQNQQSVNNRNPSTSKLRENSRTSSASSKASEKAGGEGKVPFTLSNAWEKKTQENHNEFSITTTTESQMGNGAVDKY